MSWEFDDKWLHSFYNRVTSEFVLSRRSLHNTHQWAITLALGVVTAVFTMGGRPSFPSENAVMALSVALPLLFRFFIRSCLECSIQHRWISIRNALDWYFALKLRPAQEREPYRDYLAKAIDAYYFRFKSPRPLRRIVSENLRLTYSLPFVLLFTLLLWGILGLFIPAAIHYGFLGALIRSITRPVGPVLLATTAYLIFYEAIAFPKISVLQYEDVKAPSPPKLPWED